MLFIAHYPTLLAAPSSPGVSITSTPPLNNNNIDNAGTIASSAS